MVEYRTSNLELLEIAVPKKFHKIPRKALLNKPSLEKVPVVGFTSFKRDFTKDVLLQISKILQNSYSAKQM